MRVLLPSVLGEWSEFSRKGTVELIWTQDYDVHLHICNKFCVVVSDDLHIRWEKPVLVMKDSNSKEKDKFCCKFMQKIEKIALVGEENVENLARVLDKMCGKYGVLDHRIVEFYLKIKDTQAFNELCNH
jgi:hypothetical protein